MIRPSITSSRQNKNKNVRQGLCALPHALKQTCPVATVQTKGVLVPISASVQKLLAKRYPHSVGLLKVFIPLFELRLQLADALAPPKLPELDANSFLQGKAWLAPDKSNIELYLDQPFLELAPKAMTRAAATALPKLKEACKKLGNFLAANPAECKKLVQLTLLGKAHRIAYWAKTQGQDRHVASLLSLHLAGTAARRVATAAKDQLLRWEKAWCPICGNMAHAACLRHKEGQRFLQCGLCGHEWRFSRTVCPVCEEERPENLLVYFLENDMEARAEGCQICKHYLLVPDVRPQAEPIALELLCLCLMPLDLIMQEKGYIPVAQAKL